MLHIILLILKILGCIILGILALLLAAVLIALFVPFKYELSAAYDGQPEASGKLSWLFGAMKVQGEFKDKKLWTRASILWFRIFSMGETADAQTDDVPEETEKSSASAELSEPTQTEPLENASPENALPENKPPENKPPEVESLEPESPPIEDLEIKNPAEQSKENHFEEKDSEEAHFNEKAAAPEKKRPKPKKVKRAEKSPKAKAKNKPGLFERLEKHFEHISKKYDALMHKKELAERFWNADFTQGSISFGKKAIASLFRHVLPKKVSGKIHFGFDKPSDTGKILGYASMLYAWYGDSLTLQPDFEQAVLEGNIDIRGSLRLYIFLYWGLRGLLNKDLRKLLKFIKHFKSKEETLWQ